MKITISADAEVAVLDEFSEWLRSDDDLVRSAEIYSRSSGSAGQMGGLELIDVVMTHATGLASLALAYVAWRQSRAEGPRVTFTREDGRSVTVQDGTSDEVSAIVAAFAGDEERYLGPEGGQR